MGMGGQSDIKKDERVVGRGPGLGRSSGPGVDSDVCGRLTAERCV